MVEVRRIGAAVATAEPPILTSSETSDLEPAGARGVPHGMGEQDLLQLYYYLKLGRLLEERLYTLYRQGRIPGAVYLGRGQEATTIGATPWSLRTRPTAPGMAMIGPVAYSATKASCMIRWYSSTGPAGRTA